MKKLVSVFLVFATIFTFTGCQKEATKTDFIKFANNCLAEKYYDICYSFLDDNKSKYYYNEADLIFPTSTMALIYSCDSDEFKQIKSNITENFDTYILVEEAQINETNYKILYVNDDNRQYGGFKEFGYIALNEKSDEIRFYWFYNQDYDESIFSKTSFNRFYESNFDWLKI